MATKSIALAYCIDNLHTAEAIESALEKTDYTFEHFYCKKNSTQQPLSVQLQDYPGPILLLVSDNFLRSISCMQRSLQLIQQKHDQILPVVVDGFRHDDNGDIQTVHTQFEKIGDIIPYINYWQNQYLDLRGQRKHIEEDTDYDKDAFADHLRVLRQVSSEASEFLRVIRNMHYVNFTGFTDNHFAAFFEWLQDEEEWEAFQAKVPNVHIPPITPLSDAEQGETEEHALMEDEPVAEDDTSTEHVEEAPLIDQIPGLELLEESENIARIITQKMENLPPQEEQEDRHEQENEIEEEEPILTPSEKDPESEGAQPVEEDAPLGEEPPQPDPEPSREEEQDEDDLPSSEQPSTPDEQPLHADTESGPNDNDSHTEQVSEKELIQEGMQLIKQGDIEGGLAFMNQSLQDYPNMNDLRYYYSLMLAQNTSDFSGAINQLYTLLEMDPDHVDGNFLMGELAELEDHYERALDYYKRVAELDSHYPDIYYRLGVVTLNHFPGEKKKAAKYFKKAAKRNEEHVDAHYQYALLMNESLGKPHKALKYFLIVSELEDDHPFVYYDLALLYYKNGDQEKARAYYEKAVRLNPELKTQENDRAFLGTPEEHTPQAQQSGRTFASTGPVSEQETINALKENIRHLEALIQEKSDRVLAPTPEPKTVLITGATSGIGKATAYVFAREGYRLILNGRRAERLAQLKDELEQQYGNTILSLPFDVSSYSSVQSAIQRLEGEWRNIDVLVNNAGKAKGLSPVHEGDIDHWEEMIDVNLKGLLYLTREVTPLMVQRGEGHVINLCSTAGKEVYPKGNVYCATKHAVDALTKAMRIDLYEHNIRVSQVSPAHVEETEFAEVRFDGDKERAKIYDDFNPLTSHDVAEAIFFIASRPPHVNVQDVLLMGTQQANSLFIDRSGRRFDEEE